MDEENGEYKVINLDYDSVRHLVAQAERQHAEQEREREQNSSVLIVLMFLIIAGLFLCVMSGGIPGG